MLCISEELVSEKGNNPNCSTTTSILQTCGMNESGTNMRHFVKQIYFPLKRMHLNYELSGENWWHESKTLRTCSLDEAR